MKLNCGGTTNTVIIVITFVGALLLSFAPLLGRALLNAENGTNETYGAETVSYTFAAPSIPLPTILMMMGNLILPIVALSREIQFFERNNMYLKCVRITNGLGATLLILTAISWGFAVIFDTINFNLIHVVGAVCGVITSEAWSLLHTILTFIERYGCGNEYPNPWTRFIELIYFIPGVIISTYFWIVYFVYELKGDGLDEDELDDIDSSFNIFSDSIGEYESKNVYEWWGWWVLWGQFFLWPIMFFRNSVNDELYDFFHKYSLIFACNRNKNKDKNTNQSSDKAVVQMSSATASAENSPGSSPEQSKDRSQFDIL